MLKLSTSIQKKSTERIKRQPRKMTRYSQYAYSKQDMYPKH